MSHRDTSDQVAEIRRLWGDTLEKNLAVAQIVLGMYLPKGEYDQANLPFQYSWFRRLKKIGSHKAINDAQYHEILPDARRTLYQISQLNSVGFDLAVEEGIIHPRVTAEEIEQWRLRKLPAPKWPTVNLRITAIVPTKDEAEPDEEDRDMLISTFRYDLKSVGYHLSDRSGASKFQYAITEKNPSRIDRGVFTSDLKTRGPVRE